MIDSKGEPQLDFSVIKKKESTKMSFSLVASHIATWKDEIKVLPQKKRVLFLDKLKMEVSHSF